MSKLTVAIDGPASSGKSTIAKALAKKYQLIYLDTGAMYRCVTLYLLQTKKITANDEELEMLLKNITIHFEVVDDVQRVFLNDVDVTDDIRSNDVTTNVSFVSSKEVVRVELVKQQQAYIQGGGIVMDGRDIGTVVMPNADIKIFMVASVEERAQRRYKENQQRGIEIPLSELTEQIKHRDEFDSNREIAPLKKADDAIVLDTSHLSIDEVVSTIGTIIDGRSYTS